MFAAIVDDGNIFGKGATRVEGDDRSFWKLVVPDSAKPAIKKYIIEFKVGDDPTTLTVDPYLEFPDDRRN